MSSSYKFEWIDADTWRLTSKSGMVWEARMCYDRGTCNDNGLMHLEAKLVTGKDNPIPVNGMETIRYYVKQSMMSGLRRLMYVMLNRQCLNKSN